MGRPLPIIVDNARKADNCTAHWLLDVTLSDGTPLHIGSGEIVVDGTTYQAALLDNGEIRFSKSIAPDGGKFELENSTHTYGAIEPDITSKLTGAAVVIKYAAKDPATGDYAAIEIGHGSIEDTEIGPRVVFRAESDMTNKGAVVGGEELTQHCRFQFPDCGWTLANGGDPTACDYTRNGPNGCNAHGVPWLFGGLDELGVTAAAVANPQPGNGWPVEAFPNFPGHPVEPRFGGLLPTNPHRDLMF